MDQQLLAQEIIKEADALLYSLDQGVVNVPALRSFLERLKRPGKQTVKMHDRVKHYLTKLDTSKRKKP